jgi:hypothetical protein
VDGAYVRHHKTFAASLSAAPRHDVKGTLKKSDERIPIG